MIGDTLPNEHHIVRYIKPSSIDDDHVDGSEFCLRPDETGISVNWLEYYDTLDKDAQLAEIRKVFRLSRRKAGRFAELNVGTIRKHLAAELKRLRILHAPLDAEGDQEADPSHSEIIGLPAGDSDQAALVGDMIAECICKLHLAFDK